MFIEIYTYKGNLNAKAPKSDLFNHDAEIEVIARQETETYEPTVAADRTKTAGDRAFLKAWNFG
jgi:hypothetical protein